MPTAARRPAEQVDYLVEMAQEHETMEAMAEDTGGKAVLQHQRPEQAVAKAIENRFELLHADLFADE